MKVIPVYNKNKIVKYAKISDEDYSRVSQHKWFLVGGIKGKYVWKRWNKNGWRKGILLHRYILRGIKSGLSVDHIDGDTLNNTRDNLRMCLHKENRRNSKLSIANKWGLKGVGWKEDRNKWRARIKVDYKSLHLGYFKTKEEAAIAYDVAAKKYFGEYARLNNARKEIKL